MSGKGKGKVRRGSVQKKDKQPKRWGSFPVSVPVKGGHSVFKVSVPLSSLPSNILLAHQQHASITSPPFIHSASASTQPSHSQPHINGYKRILSSLDDVIETLKLNSGARDKLTSLYQKHKWLSIAAKPVEDDLVKLALNRIKQDPSQFDMFISMLHKIEGMDLIVETLTGDVISPHTPSLSTSLPLHAPPTKRVKTDQSCLLPPSLPSSSTSVSPSVPTTSPVLSRYAGYLRAVYFTCPVARADKFPPTPSKVFIKLALVKKEKMNRAQVDKFTRLTLQGGIDKILGFKKPIEMEDILKADDKIRLVVVEGAPGIGKSTLAWELCRQWPTLESLQRFSLVVLLRLREEGVQSATDISDFFPCGDDPDLSSLVAGEVKSENGDGVLFVFDGFDEFPSELQEKSLVMDIIRGSTFPKATVLVTSRPSASAQLQILLQTGIGKHIEVVGFSENEIFDFAHSVFGDTKLFTDFKAYLTANPVVKGMMYNPLNSAIVVGVYQDTYKLGKPVPHTQTQLYTELTMCLLSRCLSATGKPLARKLPDKLGDLPRDSDLYQQLVKVGELAFNGKLKDEVIFKQLPVGCSSLGLLVKHTALYTRKESTTYNFFHLTLQEYMSAFYISQLPADEQKTLFSEHSTSINVVWRFVAGLTKMQSIGWDEFKKVEKNGVCGSYKVKDNSVDVGPFLLQCLYEAQDVECCENVFGQHLVEFIPDGEPEYSLALGYCISACSNTWSVLMDTASNEGLQMLGHGMKSVEYGGGSIWVLQLLGYEEIGEHLLQMPHEIFQYMSSLCLKWSIIDQRWLDNLTECIPYLPYLTALTIGDYVEGSVTSVKLLQELKKLGELETLDMHIDGIYMDDVTALAELTQQPSSSLRYLAVGNLYLNIYVVEQLIKQFVMSPSSLNTVTIRDYNPIDDIETISLNISTLAFKHNPDNSFDISDDDSTPLTADDSTPLTADDFTPLTANPTRVKGGTKLSNILRENTTLKNLELHLPLDKDEVQNIIDSLKDNHSLERLKLSKEYHSNYFSELEHHALDPRIKFSEFDHAD